jgi:hypothetical protein
MKHLKLITASFGACSLLLAPQLVQAQPTLRADNTSPLIGEVLTTNTTAGFNPGPGGANQTWNFASLIPTGMFAIPVVSTASTGYGANFPNTNQAYRNSPGNFDFYNATAAVYQFYGNGDSAVSAKYSDPEDLMHFPFTYNDSFSDKFACTFLIPMYTVVYRTGTVKVTADGYGTLILPGGTYTNVLRVHSFELKTDSSVQGCVNVQSLNADQVTTDKYMWYLPGNHIPIAYTTTWTNSSSTSSTGGYVGSVKTGIEETRLLSEFTLYPNPTNGANIRLNFVLNKECTFHLGLYNAMGAQVGDVLNETGAEGANVFELHTAELSEGIYFARINLPDGKAYSRKILVSN